jgi:tetratricopeptide (TPR) repeat protein
MPFCRLCEISSPQLSEVESKNPSSPYLSAVGSNISASRHYPSAIFAVSDAKLFDQENEMKKLFGSRIIQAEAGTASGSGARRNRRRPINRKATLANPNDHWPPFANCGLSMEFMGKSNGNNPTTDKILVLFNVELEISNFQVTHSSNYVQVQKNFLDFMALHDPSLIGQLLQSNPYHVDSLLVMSEVLKQSGDITSAAILIERALYAFERTFHSMFNATLGTCHLSYFRAENRSFYIALFRHIQYVSRKGCWRTAFELNRFLLSLDPSNDPMGVLLMIDFFGLQSGQFKALHGIYKTLKWRKRLDLLPNWSYSLALIYNEEGKREKCVAQLEKAIIQFPNVVKLLIEKSSHFIAAKLKDHLYLTESDNKGLDLLQKIYVARSSSLWKPAGLQGLISEALTNALAKVDSNDSFVDTAKNFRQTEYASLPQNIYRHAMLADLGNEVNVSVPPEMISGRGGIHMHDPLPPISGAEPSVYDNYLEDREAAITENRRLQGNPLYLLLESLIPNWTPEVNQHTTF